MGGLKTLRQNNFLFDMANSEELVSLNFVSFSFDFFLAMNPFLTNYISPPLLLSLSRQFLISKFSI